MPGPHGGGPGGPHGGPHGGPGHGHGGPPRSWATWTWPWKTR